MNGKGGCNNYSGSIKNISQDTLVLGPIAATKMFCKQSAEVESLFFTALKEVQLYKIDSTKLELKNRDGEILITAKKK